VSADDEPVPGYRPLEETATASDELWSFTVALYKCADVEPWCLEWQRGNGMDISFALWAAWLQHMRRITLSESDLGAALNLVAEWRGNVIVPVREARRYLKTAGLEDSDPEAYRELRAHLRAAELGSERREQQLLIAYSETLAPGPAAAGYMPSNFGTYLRYLVGPRGTLDCDRVARIDAFAAAIARSGDP